MGNGSNSNPPNAKGTPQPAASVPEPASTVEVAPVLTIPTLSDEQFELQLRALVFSNVLAGYLAQGKTPTPSHANLKFLKAYGEAVLEMVHDIQ